MISDALATVRARLEAAGGRDVTLVAVTKGRQLGDVVEAVDLGLTHLAESYAQEVVSKFPLVSAQRSLSAVELHFIGRLQTNKVRALSPWITRWDSLDSQRVVDEVSRRCPGARVLIQVNATMETGKGGVAPEGVGELLDHARQRGLQVEGLMTVGPTHGGPEAARPCFATVRALVERFDLSVCSMGMSDDLEVAVAEGSTEVRIGSALFGSRPRREGRGAVA